MTCMSKLLIYRGKYQNPVFAATLRGPPNPPKLVRDGDGKLLVVKVEEESIAYSNFQYILEWR